MEIVLNLRDNASVDVHCNRIFSHSFDIQELPRPENIYYPPNDPVDYGRRIYNALFSNGSAISEQLNNLSFGDRVILVTIDAYLQAVPWEYMHNGDNYLIEDFHFVRGIPEEKRAQRAEPLRGVNIVAIPSNPLDDNIAHLNIDGEWIRLRENVEKINRKVVLERVRPATLDALRGVVSTKKDLIVHFMGHGSYNRGGAVLVFEKNSGAIDLVTAKDFVRRIRGTAFLVTLNACVTATPGATEFANLAEALVKNGIPYALGMRFSITDEDARIFSRVFYRELAGGASVEEAVFQARLELANSKQSWAIGVPVLYTSMSEVIHSETVSAGMPNVVTNDVRTNFVDIPRAVEFQGRTGAIVQIGERLTSDNRPSIFTIHGVGGQGKTALAREVAERFAYAYPGGAYAVSLENLPKLADFVVTIGNFLGIDTRSISEYRQIESLVLTRLQTQRVMIILDNTETLINAVEAKSDAALELVDFLKNKLSGTLTTLLVTSRELLGWPGEEYITLGGLSEKEGSLLFIQSMTLRLTALDISLVSRICRQVDGHPLSLQLLAGAFDNSAVSLEEFVIEYEQHLAQSFDKYKSEKDRHYSLQTSIETSLRYLAPELRDTLQKLTVFSTYFLPDLASQILKPSSDDQQHTDQSVPDQLHQLWKRSLLLREERTFPNKEIILYRLLPVVRLYLKTNQQQQGMEDIGKRFAKIYADLASILDLDTPSDIFTARNILQDFETARGFLSQDDVGEYNLRLETILMRLGYSGMAISLLEESLEIAQSTDDLKLYTSTLKHLMIHYTLIGDRGKVVQLSEYLIEKVSNRVDRSEYLQILDNMVFAYNQVGLVNQAIDYAQNALDIARELNLEDQEASVLSKLGVIYREAYEYEKAEAVYLRAKEIYEKNSYQEDYVNLLLNLSTVYVRNDIDKTIELRVEALEIARKIQNTRYEAEALNALGIAYAQRGDIDNGFKYLDDAIALFRSMSEIRSECNALDFKARVYREQIQFEKAIDIYEQLLTLTERSGLIGLHISYMTNLGNVYSRSSRPEQAAFWFRKAYQEAQISGDRLKEAASAYRLSTAVFDLGNSEEAITLAERVVEILDMENLSRIPDQDVTREHVEKLLQWYHQGTMLDPEHVNNMIEMAGILGGDVLRVIVQAFFSGSGKFRVDIEFMQAVAELINGGNGVVPPSNPHFQAFQKIKQNLLPHRRISEQGRQAIVQNTLLALEAAQEERDNWRDQVTQLRSQFNQDSEVDEWQYLSTILNMLEGKQTTLSESNFYYSDYETIDNDQHKNERINEAFIKLQQVRSSDEMLAAVSEHPIMMEPDFIQVVDNAIHNQIPSHLRNAFDQRIFWIRQIRIQQLKQEYARLQSEGNSDQELSVLVALGFALAEIQVPHMAIEYFEQALARTDDQDDIVNKGKILTNIGIIYQSVLRYEQALQHYYQARELFIASEMDDLMEQVDAWIKEIEANRN